MKRHRLIILAVVLKAALIGAWLAPAIYPEPAIAEQTEKEKTSQVKADFLIDEKERGLIGALNRRQKELDEKEEELRLREERLYAVKADLDAKIAEIARTNSKIEAGLKKIDEVNTDRVKKIVKIYESMNPEDSAARLEKLDEELAVMILASMSERKAAKILGFVDPDKSAKLSKALKIKE